MQDPVTDVRAGTDPPGASERVHVHASLVCTAYSKGARAPVPRMPKQGLCDRLCPFIN